MEVIAMAIYRPYGRFFKKNTSLIILLVTLSHCPAVYSMQQSSSTINNVLTITKYIYKKITNLFDCPRRKTHQPETTISQSEDKKEETCTICNEKFTNEFKTPCCKQKIHETCLSRCQNRCPFCRKTISIQQQNTVSRRRSLTFLHQRQQQQLEPQRFLQQQQLQQQIELPRFLQQQQLQRSSANFSLIQQNNFSSNQNNFSNTNNYQINNVQNSQATKHQKEQERIEQFDNNNTIIQLQQQQIIFQQQIAIQNQIIQQQQTMLDNELFQKFLQKLDAEILNQVELNKLYELMSKYQFSIDPINLTILYQKTGIYQQFLFDMRSLEASTQELHNNILHPSNINGFCEIINRRYQILIQKFNINDVTSLITELTCYKNSIENLEQLYNQFMGFINKQGQFNKEQLTIFKELIQKHINVINTETLQSLKNQIRVIESPMELE